MVNHSFGPQSLIFITFRFLIFKTFHFNTWNINSFEGFLNMVMCQRVRVRVTSDRVQWWDWWVSFCQDTNKPEQMGRRRSSVPSKFNFLPFVSLLNKKIETPKKHDHVRWIRQPRNCLEWDNPSNSPMQCSYFLPLTSMTVSAAQHHYITLHAQQRSLLWKTDGNNHIYPWMANFSFSLGFFLGLPSLFNPHPL